MENKIRNPKNIIIALTVAHNCDFNAIKKAIETKQMPTNEEIEKASGVDAITIIDDNYPTAFKSANRPPFVLFVASEGGSGCRLGLSTRAEAWIQERKASDFWWNGSIQSHKDVVKAFENEVIVSVNDKAEIVVRKGDDYTAYRTYCGRDPIKEDFSEAFVVASALAKRLFIFHSRPKGDEYLMLALFGLNSPSSIDSIYVTPEDYCSDMVSDCNRLIEEGARILTKHVITKIVDNLHKED